MRNPHKKKIARERLAILKIGRWASFAHKSNPQYTPLADRHQYPKFTMRMIMRNEAAP